MESSTSEAYDHSACLDFGYDGELFDDDGSVDDEDGCEGLERKNYDWRPSPACVWTPTAKGLFHKHREPVSELLNLLFGNLRADTVTFAEVPRRVVDHRGYAQVVPTFPQPFGNRRERIAAMGYLTAPGELAAVLEEVERTWRLLLAAFAGASPDMPPSSFAVVDHQIRDWRIIAATSGLHPVRVWHEWESLILGRLRQAPELKAYYRVRDAMRAQWPEIFRKAARERDAKRRQTKHRQEYLASEEVKAADAERQRNAPPEVKASRAEHMRQVRAAWSPEKKLAESQKASARRKAKAAATKAALAAVDMAAE